MSESDTEPFTRTFGHGGIKLTAYPSSGRIGVEVSAVNAVMDWWELEDFVAELKAAKPITSVRDLPRHRAGLDRWHGLGRMGTGTAGSHVIPDEAVEAAARAQVQSHGAWNWDALPEEERRGIIAEVRVGLEAAAPHMAAQALRDAVDAFPLETITAPDNAVAWLMRRAEQLGT